MEKDSTKDVEKVKIEDISLGYLKKVVHTIMIKFYGNAGYRHSDLIRKMLRKLKCDYSPKAASRVRNQLRNWIISNNEIVKFGNVESKKGILSDNSKQGIIKNQKKKKIDIPNNTNEEIENSTNINNLNVVDSTSLNTEKHTDQNDKSMGQDDVSISTEKQSDYNKVLVFDPENTGLKTQVCNCACKCKDAADRVTIKQELIDLTIDDDLVKTEDDDEKMYDIKYAGTFTMSATTEESLPNSNEKDFLQSSTMSDITDSSGVVESVSKFVYYDDKDVHSNKENLRDNKVIEAVSDKSSCSVEQLDSSSCSFKTSEETGIIDIKQDIGRINSDIESEEGIWKQLKLLFLKKSFVIQM